MPDISPPLSTAPLLADGAMGTMLYTRRVCFEDCFDELNMSNPAGVAPVPPEHIEAGAQIVLTNTFASDHFKPEPLGLVAKNAKTQPAGVEPVWQARAESFLGWVHA